MKKEFTIKVEIEERWINHLMSMLNHMESLGKMGSSQTVALYSDGDGDFRPKFEADVEWEIVEPVAADDELSIYGAG